MLERSRHKVIKKDSLFNFLIFQIIICTAIFVFIYLLSLTTNPLYDKIKENYNKLFSNQDYLHVSISNYNFGDAKMVMAQIIDNITITPITPPKPESEGQGGMFSIGEKTMFPPKGTVLSPAICTQKVYLPLYGKITSPYGFRYHPVTDSTDFHTGVDIASLAGTAIHAAFSGKVVEVGESQIYGKYIILEHSPDFQTTYNHCSEIIAEEGVYIRAGERIAKVGSTGISTGPHLHFEVKVDGIFTNPMWVLGA